MAGQECSVCVRVIRAALSATTLDEWSAFLEAAAEQAGAEDSSARSGSTHTLKERELHLAFEAMIEKKTRQICEAEGVDQNAFHREFITEALLTGDRQPVLATFAEVLLMASQFDVFADVLHSRPKREYLLQILRGYSNSFDSSHSQRK